MTCWSHGRSTRRQPHRSTWPHLVSSHHTRMHTPTVWTSLWSIRVWLHHPHLLHLWSSHVRVMLTRMRSVVHHLVVRSSGAHRSTRSHHPRMHLIWTVEILLLLHEMVLRWSTRTGLVHVVRMIVWVWHLVAVLLLVLLGHHLQSVSRVAVHHVRPHRLLLRSALHIWWTRHIVWSSWHIVWTTWHVIRTSRHVIGTSGHTVGSA